MKTECEVMLSDHPARIDIEKGVLDSLTAHVAVLDSQGRILRVNRAWQDFAVANASIDPVRAGVGVSYLDACDRAAESGCQDAVLFSEGLRSVISGERQHFEQEYACHSPEERRWFTGRVTRFGAGSLLRVVVAHENITRRKEAEMTLHESETRYRSLFELSPVPKWVIDEKTYRFLAVNRAAVELYGYSKEEFLGISLQDILIPGEMPQFLARFVRDYPDEDPAHARHRKKDGTAMEVEIRSCRIDFDGRTARLASATDVTERNQAKRALESKSREITGIWENMTEGFFALDTEWRFTYVNSQAAQMWRREPEELLGRNLWKEFPAAVNTAFHRMYHKAAEEQVKVDFEEFYPPLNAWREVHVYPSASGLSIYFHDITERKLAEEERDRFFTLSLDMLAIAGSDGYFKRLNPAFETTLGFSKAELQASPFLDFVHPEDRSATMAIMAELDNGDEVRGFVNRYHCQDGTYKWLSWRTAPFEGQYYAVAHDITAIKQTEAALQKANNDLEARVIERTAALEISCYEMKLAKQAAEAANNSKSEFLSRMSHELRTPLNAILGFGQILDQQELTALQKESVGHIIKGGRHLLGLINEVLDIARVAAGNGGLSIEPVLLAEVVQECCALLAPLAALRNIAIVPDLSNLTQTYALADRQRLKQVFLNILSNGIKYNRIGGQVKIYDVQEPNGRVCIAVHDTGHGIAAEDLPKLFTPFERLAAEKSGVEGTGLGLVLSRRLITAMGGTLEVESVVEYGTTFLIELTRASEPVAALACLPERSNEPGDLERLRCAATVLCIEDNLANLRLMEVLLAGCENIELLAAMQGSVGLDLARQMKPDVILLDLNLPDLSGKEVLARLQQSAITRDIPVIIISADATPSQVERVLDAGAKAYLTKPLDIAEFLKVLNQVLQAGA